MKRLVCVVVLAVLCGLTGSAVATAEPRPRLKVTGLSSPPATAKAGGTFTVSGAVKNTGDKSARARVRVSLRTAKNGAVAAVLLTTSKLSAKPGRKKRFSATVTIPAASAPGSYVLVACVPKRGRSGPEVCTASGAVAVTSAAPPAPAFTPGARSAGDSLFPQIGNGGYDARHYDIELAYDPDDNTFGPGTSTTMTAVATQDLSRLSLDFQQLDVSAVLVDGAPAAFTQEEALPALTSSIVTDPTQPSKLTVTPASGIAKGATFLVEVRYTGEPEVWTDVDGALEGWVPACYTLLTETCEGNFVVGEPLGSQAWFPSNNVPADKATFDTAITLPSDQVAVGVGELVGGVQPDVVGLRTWRWSEDDPISPYLATASNGAATFTQDSMVLGGRTIPIYDAIDSSMPLLTAGVEATLEDGKDMLSFLEGAYGAYPFDSTGAWVDRSDTIGYALEVATKSHYPGSTMGPSVDASTELHELSHQWFGNTVTNQDWADLWFNEGWAQWSTWYWNDEENGSATTPAAQFTTNYNSGPSTKWATPPATMNGNPELLFEPSFPTYTRGAMTLEGYRQIIGPAQFLLFAKALQTSFAHDNISTAELVGFAVAFSGFTGSDRTLLESYFQQWLYGSVQPTILPSAF